MTLTGHVNDFLEAENVGLCEEGVEELVLVLGLVEDLDWEHVLGEEHLNGLDVAALHDEVELGVLVLVDLDEELFVVGLVGEEVAGVVLFHFTGWEDAHSVCFELDGH